MALQVLTERMDVVPLGGNFFLHRPVNSAHVRNNFVVKKIARTYQLLIKYRLIFELRRIVKGVLHLRNVLLESLYPDLTALFAIFLLIKLVTRLFDFLVLQILKIRTQNKYNRSLEGPDAPACHFRPIWPAFS
jgi:hypothetical protein